MSVLELEHQARMHWTKWLPRKVQELRHEGRLGEALQGAAKLAQQEIEFLMREKGYQEHEAREVALSHFILLPPESGAGHPAWERQELVEREREYQANLPPMVEANLETDREQEQDEMLRQRRSTPSSSKD